jgi:hypothetical protein
MERVPERVHAFSEPRTLSRPTSTPPIRQPVPGELRRLPSLQVPGVGRQKRH